jgi:lipopolysaccharide transport system ATP-binding protein
MSKSIVVEDLSKIYRLGEIGTGTISRDLERWFKMKFLNQEDPFLKIGETNDRASKGASDIVYSLREINFEINQGDAVGIIGRNGAGKSTLLKILSRVTTPTTGRINIKGRVASLLEVGTGFHPELTGRENIYLNGAILGMRKREIDRKLDEIIDFSGVERYIDTPVKRYSSGMYVRLAFAVAAHLESEILIIDEVLAVGDAEFQKKCLGKMGEVSKGEGRTVLFVSHNMSAISQLCTSGIFLQHGVINIQSEISKVLSQYAKSLFVENKPFEKISTDHFNLLRIITANKEGNSTSSFSMDEDVVVQFSFEKISNLSKSYLHLTVNNEMDLTIVEVDSNDWNENIFATDQKGKLELKLTFRSRIFGSGKHRISIGLSSEVLPGFQIFSAVNVTEFEIEAGIMNRDNFRIAASSYFPEESFDFQML